MKWFARLSSLKNRISWKILAGAVFTALVIYGNYFLYDELTRLPPEEDVRQSLVKTLNAVSYRYHAIAVRTLDGTESVIMDMEGSRNHQGVHLQGKVPLVNAEIEVYQLEEKLYRRDSLTQGWMIVPIDGRISLENLIAEINPLSIFNYLDDIDVKYVGKEKVNGRHCRVYEIMTRGENKFLELYWQDFNYRLWIDKKEGVFSKVEVYADHRDNTEHKLKVTIEITDFNKEFTFEIP